MISSSVTTSRRDEDERSRGPRGQVAVTDGTDSSAPSSILIPPRTGLISIFQMLIVGITHLPAISGGVLDVIDVFESRSVCELRLDPEDIYPCGDIIEAPPIGKRATSDM